MKSKVISIIYKIQLVTNNQYHKYIHPQLLIYDSNHCMLYSSQNNLNMSYIMRHTVGIVHLMHNNHLSINMSYFSTYKIMYLHKRDKLILYQNNSGKDVDKANILFHQFHNDLNKHIIHLLECVQNQHMKCNNLQCLSKQCRAKHTKNKMMQLQKHIQFCNRMGWIKLNLNLLGQCRIDSLLLMYHMWHKELNNYHKQNHLNKILANKCKTKQEHLEPNYLFLNIVSK